MTCIVAIKDNGNLYFGADSHLSDKEYSFAQKSSKLFRNGPIVFGYAGGVRAGKVFQYDLTLPPVDYENLDRYLNREFITALMDCAERNKLVIDEEKESNDIADLIIGVGGRLFEVQSHVQTVEPTENYIAGGAGARVAYGSLYSTKHLPAKQRVKLALAASATYSWGVGRPFRYLTVRGD